MNLNKIIKIIICPFCGSGDLDFHKDSINCNGCYEKYFREDGVYDMRLKKPKKVKISFTLDNYNVPPKGNITKPLKLNQNCDVDYSDDKIPDHLSKELISYIPRAKGKDCFALDLGCGSGVHKEILEKAGYQYIGLDYERSGADIFGDAHSIPFAEKSIDLVLSMAVLEHIQYPFIYAKEVYRILKTNGTLIGSVAFLEGFHSNSYYHHTHYGTYNTFNSAGFKDITIAPNQNWNVIKAQTGHLFPYLPRKIARSIVYPIYFLHLCYWRILRLFYKRFTEEKRVLNVAASFFFIVKK